jgi:glycosyltransferase involved in cell wall biosynthesis
MPGFIVVLRGSGDRSDCRRTLDALERTTPDLEIRHVDETSHDLERVLAASNGPDRRTCLVCSSGSGVLPEYLAWNAVLSAPEADVVLVEVGTAVNHRWHELLQNAAYADALNATASAVTLELLTLDRNARDLLADASLPERRVALGAPLWGCVYLRRDALIASVATRDAAALRVSEFPALETVTAVPGFIHVLSTAVVLPAPRRTSRPSTSVLTPAVRRMLSEIEAAVAPLRVTVDLRCCAAPLSGTQVHALNLAKALADRPDVRLDVLVPRKPHRSARPHLAELPATVTRRVPGERIGPQPHVFHRPYQLLSENEIVDVVSSGTRLVVTHQDLILDRTPAYFSSTESWHDYVRTTALTFAVADEVVFFSEHARKQAIADGLLEASKASVVPPGTNHLDQRGAEAVPGGLVKALESGSKPFLLTLGNAFAHKNRLFVLRVADELIRGHSWDGVVVFAGGKPRQGASADQEAALVERLGLASSFVDLGPVSDPERRWLYRNAALVLFPTLYEGFGLVPFECAAEGTPCVYSDRSSVGEYLPKRGALLDLGDPPGTARRLRELVNSPGEAAEIVRAIRRAGASLTWSSAAARYVDVYRRAMARPVGVPLVIGERIAIASVASIASNDTERHVLLALRRVSPVRLLARAVLSLFAAARRIARRR